MQHTRVQNRTHNTQNPFVDMLAAVAPWRHAVVPVSELERTRIFDAARDGDLAVLHALVRRENVNAVRSSDADVALITPLLMQWRATTSTARDC